MKASRIGWPVLEDTVPNIGTHGAECHQATSSGNCCMTVLFSAYQVEYQLERLWEDVGRAHNLALAHTFHSATRSVWKTRHKGCGGSIGKNPQLGNPGLSFRWQNPTRSGETWAQFEMAKTHDYWGNPGSVLDGKTPQLRKPRLSFRWEIPTVGKAWSQFQHLI